MFVSELIVRQLSQSAGLVIRVHAKILEFRAFALRIDSPRVLKFVIFLKKTERIQISCIIVLSRTDGWRKPKFSSRIGHHGQITPWWSSITEDYIVVGPSISYTLLLGVPRVLAHRSEKGESNL